MATIVRSTRNDFDDENSYGYEDFDGDFISEDDENYQSDFVTVDLEVKLAARQKVLEYIMSELSQFDTKVRDILMLRWGIAFGQAHSNAEIGEIFGVSAEAIKKAQNAATMKLRSVKFFTNLKKIMRGEELIQACEDAGEEVQYILYDEAQKPAELIAEAINNSSSPPPPTPSVP